MKYCTSCGAQLPEGAKFCVRCGAPAGGPRPAALPAAGDAGRSAAKQGVRQSELRGKPAGKEAVNRAAPSPADSVAAAERPGEVPALEFGPAYEGAGAPGKPAGQLLPPLRALLQTLRRFFGGIVGLFTDPKRLIALGLILALWLLLWLLRKSSALPFRILSWLSYAQGGTDRGSIPGAVAGVLGKGTVAAALLSAVFGGLPRFGKGLVSMIKGTGEKRGPLCLLIGVLVGAGLYLVFTGPKLASARTAMVGVAGAFLALQAAGGRQGPLYELALSLTAKTEDGLRRAQSGKAQSLLAGLSLGFAAAAGLCCLL